MIHLACMDPEEYLPNHNALLTDLNNSFILGPGVDRASYNATCIKLFRNYRFEWWMLVKTNMYLMDISTYNQHWKAYVNLNN